MSKPLFVAISGGDTLFRKGLEFIINSYNGMETILVAEDLPQLIKQLKKLKLPVDTLLHDIGSMDPVKLYPELLKYKNEITSPLILLTAQFDESLLFQAMDIGIASYLPKDIDTDEIAYAIKQVCQNGVYFKYFPNKKSNGLLSKTRNLDLSSISFTKREIEILQFICEQYTTSEIAEELYISPRTVDGHRNNLLEKTSSKNTAGLVVFALQHKIVNVKDNKKSG